MTWDSKCWQERLLKGLVERLEMVLEWMLNDEELHAQSEFDVEAFIEV
jgi:hypothetical protein